MIPRNPGPAELRQLLGGGVVTLDTEDILRLLPNRPPMLLVDRVISLIPGQHAVGTKIVTGNEAGLSRRQHGFVFPASMGLESLVQLATIVVVYPENGSIPPDYASGRMAAVSEIGSLRVLREMTSPSDLHLTVSCTGQTPNRYSFAGEAMMSGDSYIEASFELQVEG